MQQVRGDLDDKAKGVFSAAFIYAVAQARTNLPALKPPAQQPNPSNSTPLEQPAKGAAIEAFKRCSSANYELGYMLRKIGRLFGVQPRDEVETYRDAMKRMLTKGNES